VPERPVPEQDPIVTKSYAPHYVIAMVLLMATLFWALWDEAFGQRPWKAFQEQWKTRYTSLLKTQKTKSAQVEKEIEQSSDYQALKQKYEQAGQQATARTKEIRTQLESVGANILAVQNVFTDRRAWVNARTYEMETATSSSSKQSIQKTIDNYKAQPASVVFPDGHKEQYTFQKLEEKYNDLKTERARLNAELGEVSKPVTEAREAMSAYLGEHMVDLTPDQIKGLQDKTALWDPKIVQINIADANIVDRCESCHMGAREPIKITAAAMTSGGKKPDEYAQAFVSHPDKELLGAHDPEKFGCSACHQGNGRATSSVEKAHGDYEHWLWPLYPKQNAEAGCQTCHMADMVLASGEVGKVISDGKDLFRQRGCMGCHRYEGYDREPEELAGIQQQMKALETDKKENSKQSAYLMKQADSAATNEEANQMNQMAIALRVTNTQMDGRIHQLDLQSRSLMQDMKKVGPNLKDARLKLNKNWIPVWLKKPTDFRPTTKMPNFRLNDHQIQAISAYIWQAGLTDALPKQTAGNAAHTAR